MTAGTRVTTLKLADVMHDLEDFLRGHPTLPAPYVTFHTYNGDTTIDVFVTASTGMHPIERVHAVAAWAKALGGTCAVTSSTTTVDVTARGELPGGTRITVSAALPLAASPSVTLADVEAELAVTS